MKSKVSLKKMCAVTVSAIMLGGSCSAAVYADNDSELLLEEEDEEEDDETTSKKANKKEKSTPTVEKNNDADDDDDDDEEDPLELIGRYYDEEEPPVREEQIVVTEFGEDYVKNRSDYIEEETEPATEAKKETKTETPTEAKTEAPTEAKTEAPTEKKETATEAKTEAKTEAPTETTTDETVYWFDSDEPLVQEVELHMQRGTTLDSSYYTSYMPNTYSWSSSDPDILYVDSNGQFKAQSGGIAVVYAVNDKEVIIFSVYVKSGSSSSSNEEVRNVTIYEGDRLDLSQFVTNPYYQYNWTTAARSIAEIDEYGILRGKQDGKVTVRADAAGAPSDYIFNVTVKKTTSKSSSKSRYYDKKFTIYLDQDDSVSVAEYLDKDPGKYSWDVTDSSVAKATKSSGTIKGLKYGNTTVRALGSKDYYFNVKVSRYYDNCSVDIRVGDTFDLSRYLDNPGSYSYSYLDPTVASVENGKIVARKRGVTYIVCDNKHSNEIVQIMVEVRGTNGESSSRAQAQPTTVTQPAQAAPAAPAQTSAAPVQTGNKFNDISHRNWAITAINNMAAKGYISGRNATTFAPDDQCSKADFTIVLVKMLGIENDSYTGGFDDVNLSKYYAKYVNVARQHGLCAGVVGNNFSPEKAITREEIMYMVYKGLSEKGRTLDTNESVLANYSDAGNITAEYRGAVAALLNAGIVSGVSATSLDPLSNITRAQMAVLLNNLGM